MTTKTDKFIQRARRAHGDFYNYDKVKYETAHSRVTITCPEHGDFAQLAYTHTAGTRCPECSASSRAKKKLLTTKEWARRAMLKHEGRYDYSQSEYTGLIAKVKIVCPTHGEFEQAAGNHMNGAGCPRCGKHSGKISRTHSFAEFKELSNLRHEGRYIYPEQVYTNNKIPVTIKCPEHGVFKQRPDTHLRGSGCPECGNAAKGTKAQLGVSEFLKRANEVHNGLYEYVGLYKGMHVNTTIECAVHGLFKQTPSNHLKGAGCPRCVSHVSKAEDAIYNWIKEFAPDAVQSDRTQIKPLELDIWIPSKNIAIEYHGLYWHTDDRRSDAHRKKYVQCAAQGITLVQIFEDEWRDNAPKIKNRLLNMVGAGAVYNGRQCEIEVAEGGVVRDFLNEHHTQGAGNVFKHNRVLKHNGKLVAVMTFTKGRFGNDGWEILRYASVGRVRGGISKLVKAFIKTYDPSQLLSYADLRWGSGDGYKAAGFSLDKITDPDYWWTDGKVRISRYTLQPHKIKMSEKAYAELHNLKRITGVGHKKWVYNKP